MSIDIKKLKALAEAATGFSDVSLAPDVLLELIDQNERLTKNYKSLCDSVAHLNAATTSAGDEVARLRAENESANSRLHEVAVACATAEQERDQLRAEIAGLRTGYEAYERVNAELKAEVERLRYQIGVLQSDANSWQSGYDVGRHMGTKTVWAERRAVRKDAERYRWLRRAGNTKAIALVAEHCLDALDEAIDAALGQGERS